MSPPTLQVNGEERTVDLPPDTPLLWALRDGLGLTGTKYGCGIGRCGACTVLLDGRAARSCLTPIGGLSDAGVEVVTIEGLSERGDHPAQRAWVEEDVSQCGYCQAGMVVSIAGLLERTPDPDDAAIDAALSGHLCRCGTYGRARRAARRAVSILREGSG